jgi:hypothetical protein
MNARMTIPLDIAAVQVVKTELPRQGDWTSTGESTREGPRGRKVWARDYGVARQGRGDHAAPLADPGTERRPAPDEIARKKGHRDFVVIGHGQGGQRRDVLRGFSRPWRRGGRRSPITFSPSTTASIRNSVSSMPRLVSRLAVGVVPLSSCTTLKPSYKKLGVVPLTVLLLRRPTASYWKLAVTLGPLKPTS